MKNNILLAVVFSVLVSIAYFTEEFYPKTQTAIKKEKQSQLIDLTDVTEIKTKSFHLKKTNDSWQLEDQQWRVNPLVVDTYLKAISSLNITGSMVKSDRLTWDEDQQIEFKIKGKAQKLNLLGVSKVTGSMYLSRSLDSHLIYIVKDSSSFDEIYQSELDLVLRKYSRLKNIFNLEQESFLELNILKGLGIENLLEVSVENKRNRPYKISFAQKLTNPAIFSPLTYKNFEQALSSITRVKEIKRSIKKGRHLLTDKRSEVHFVTKEGIKIIDLFLGLNGQYGHYLKARDGDALYEVELSEDNLFFSHVQIFWSKNFHHNADFSKLKRIDFKLKKAQGENISFYVDDLKEFKVKSLNKKVNFIDTTRMNFLFNLLFNLVEFQEALFVESFQDIQQDTHTGAKEKADNKFIVHLFGNQYTVELKDQEIIVDDFNHKLRYHYSNKTGLVKDGFFDKIFTVK